MNNYLLHIKVKVLVFFCLILLVAACAPAPATATPTAAAISGGTVVPDSSPTEDGGRDGTAAGIATSVAARTPIPSPTPDRIERSVDELADRAGLGGSTFLGLTPGDWADLVFSILIVVAGYFFARIFVKRLLKWLVQHTPTKLDDEFLIGIDRRMLWLVVVLCANYAAARLDFLDEALRAGINDIFFLLTLALVTSMALALFKFIAAQYKASLTTEADQERLDPVITAVRRFAAFTALIIALSIALSHFGIDLNALYIVLIISGLIISLAAKEVISDALNGFIILIDQPFRVGDSILIKELNTWGDVLDIGTRTTRILTKDNRELIIPNSQIGKSPIMNYTYPDTKYRVQTDIELAYGIDIGQIRQLATDAVRSVKDVLVDKPVDVFFMAFDNSARKIRVRWWIATFHNEYAVLDEVNVALELAFELANIGMPSDTQYVRVQMENLPDQMSQPLGAATQEKGQDDNAG